MIGQKKGHPANLEGMSGNMIQGFHFMDKLKEQSIWENKRLIEKEEYHYSADDTLKRLYRVYPEENKEYEFEFDSNKKLIKNIIKAEGRPIFSWDKTVFDDIMAVLYLSTRFKYQVTGKASFKEIKVPGKREVLLDENEKIEAELWTNYTAVEEVEALQNDCYFTYEYGDE